jgi:hypothetical protein
MFRFTIRELVLLTIIVALGAGWSLDQWQLRRRVTTAEFLWHHFEHIKWDQEHLHQRNEQIVSLFLDAGGDWTEYRDGTIKSLHFAAVGPDRRMPAASTSASNSLASTSPTGNSCPWCGAKLNDR